MFVRHEHLYEKINKNIIVSDRLPRAGALKRVLQDSQVVLCTLSMISNPRLRDLGFIQAVPVINVIIDEASQIEVGQYVPLFQSFGKTLRKLCFIGDDKQCKCPRCDSRASRSRSHAELFGSTTPRSRRPRQPKIHIRT